MPPIHPCDLDTEPARDALNFNDLTVEDAIRRAKWSMSAAYKGRRPGKPSEAMRNNERRTMYVQLAEGLHASCRGSASRAGL
jgi:hypothetical protein